MEAQFVQVLERLNEISDEIHQMKQDRLKPYLASAGGFLVIAMGITGYVYGLETRLIDLIFSLNSEVAVLEEKIALQEDRLSHRTANHDRMWAIHNDRHDSLDEGLRLILEAVMKPTSEGDGHES